MSQQHRPSPSPSPPLPTTTSSQSQAERNFIFHRNREQPTPDPNESVINQIKFYLDRYRIKEALQIFFDENTLKLLRDDSDFMWDIIPLICKRLRGLCQYRFRVFEGCERMLCRIAVDENCNPKEVLISLLAEISQQDQYDDDNVFRAMIRPLEGTLLRMSQPSPRDENLRWVINVLLRHINDIELPQEYNLEGKKRLSLPNDPSVKRFIEILPLMLSFIEEFNEKPIDYDKSPMPILTESQIEEVFNGELIDDDLMNESSSSRSDSLNTSITALMGIMYRPLTFLDLTTFCNDLRIFANRCLNTLLKLRPNLFSPIYKRLCDKSDVTDSNCCFKSHSSGLCAESTISIATYSYIYRCERVVSVDSTQFFPQVMAHEFVLACHVPFIVALLERSEILVHEKGLILLESLLKCLEHNTLDQKFLDMFENFSLLKQLFKIIVFSPLCTNRRRAYEMFTHICDILTYDCKLETFKFVLTQTDLRPCVRAACIDQYRKHLTNVYRELMNLSQDQSSASVAVNTTISAQIKQLHGRYKAIGGQVLIDFLDLCIKACLPDLQHTDIIENYELILATLTMFRFLKLRKTIFKNEVEEDYLIGKRLKKSFFDPIRNAIALIMSELKLHHKDIVDGHKMKNVKITQSSILNVTQSRNEFDLLSRIFGPKIDDVIDPKDTEYNEQDETDCLNWALCRLDLVESVLVRTCDLYNC